MAANFLGAPASAPASLPSVPLPQKLKMCKPSVSMVSIILKAAIDSGYPARVAKREKTQAAADIVAALINNGACAEIGYETPTAATVTSYIERAMKDVKTLTKSGTSDGDDPASATVADANRAGLEALVETLLELTKEAEQKKREGGTTVQAGVRETTGKDAQVAALGNGALGGGRELGAAAPTTAKKKRERETPSEENGEEVELAGSPTAGGAAGLRLTSKVRGGLGTAAHEQQELVIATARRLEGCDAIEKRRLELDQKALDELRAARAADAAARVEARKLDERRLALLEREADQRHAESLQRIAASKEERQQSAALMTNMLSMAGSWAQRLLPPATSSPAEQQRLHARPAAQLLPPAARGTPSEQGLQARALAQARVDLAAVYRLLDKLGLNEGICNHLTALVPGTRDRFLCIRYGLLWSEVSASNLVLLDAAGQILEGEGPVETTAFEIHRAIHQADPDRHVCVLHTHMPHATALCCIEPMELRMVHQNSCRFFGALAYDEAFNGLVLDSAEGARIAAALGGKSVLLHRSHGVIVCGASIAAAFDDLYYLERAAQVQLLAMGSGMPLSVISDETAASVKAQMDAGKAEWATQHLEALKRGLMRADPSFAE